MKLQFIYGDMPFWRAEVGRLALYFGDINFDDVRIKKDEFLYLKENGKLFNGTAIPFHQIPCLVIDNVSIAQTGAIARFCGKLSGLYPKNDPIKAAKIDQFIDFVTDLNVLFSNTNTISEQAKKVAARTELAEGLLRRKLLMLENCIHPDSKWVSSKTITIADIAIWRLLGWFTSGVIDGFPKDMITLFPKLKRLCLAVDNHEKIKKWVQKTYPNKYPRGNF